MLQSLAIWPVPTTAAPPDLGAPHAAGGAVAHEIAPTPAIMVSVLGSFVVSAPATGLDGACAEDHHADGEVGRR